MIGLHELKGIRQKITAVIFRKDEYSFESIIRWLMDRGFSFEDFREEGKYYFICQTSRAEFDSFIYKKIKGYNIAIEVGSEGKGDISDLKDLDSLLGG